MRVIIAGGRDFSNYNLLCKYCDKILSKQKSIEIVSGTARGVDRLGERYAEERNYVVHRYPADWDKHGRSAGHIRNGVMANNADALIAFWDGQSRGTKNMIETAKKRNLRVRVIRY